MLGFAMRAGKLVLGTDLILASVSRKGRDGAKLVIISESASFATRDKIVRKCEACGVSHVSVDFDGEELGRLLGKLYAPVAVAVTDDNFASEIKRALTDDSQQ